MTFISAHLPHKGKKLGEFEAALMEIQEFVSGRPRQHVILGGDFNANLFGMTDSFHVGESIPKTEYDDRHKRFVACESFTHDGNRTGFDGSVFVSLISNVVDLEPGMVDCFHVEELILRSQDE